MGVLGERQVTDVLRLTHVAAVHYSDALFWGDASNKLSWLIPLLNKLFPQALFVHLARDGRKVASSYFHKLGAECYDDASTAVLQAFYDAEVALPAPPPEKKYWWPLPRRDDPMATAFRGLDQFERIVYHQPRSITHRAISSDRARAQHSCVSVFVLHGQERQRLLNFGSAVG
jgi:hypothetical protein